MPRSGNLVSGDHSGRIHSNQALNGVLVGNHVPNDRAPCIVDTVFVKVIGNWAGLLDSLMQRRRLAELVDSGLLNLRFNSRRSV